MMSLDIIAPAEISPFLFFRIRRIAITLHRLAMNYGSVSSGGYEILIAPLSRVNRSTPAWYGRRLGPSTMAVSPRCGGWQHVWWFRGLRRRENTILIWSFSNSDYLDFMGRPPGRRPTVSSYGGPSARLKNSRWRRLAKFGRGRTGQPHDDCKRRKNGSVHMWMAPAGKGFLTCR